MSNDLSELNRKKLWILDLDGTVYLSDTVFPETLPFLQRVRDHGADYVFFTNNATHSKRTYLKRLASMRIPTEPWQMQSSAETTLHYLKTRRPGKRIYLVGTPDLSSTFREADIPLYNDEIESDHEDAGTGYPFDLSTEEGRRQEARHCPIVISSFDRTLTYEKVDTACRLIRNGAEFLATHPDLNCPSEHGLIPDAGSIAAVITTATGVKPRFFGKPYDDVISLIENISGVSRKDIVVVGDSLYTDVAVGVNNGTDAVLVLTGASRREDIPTSPVKPTYVADSIGDLLRD